MNRKGQLVNIENSKKQTKVLITGCNGFLGSNLADQFQMQGQKVWGTDLHDSALNTALFYVKGDLAESEYVTQLFEEIRPDAVINTVALVDLDVCEANGDRAYRINVKTAENVARAAAKHGTRMVHISTDHLFKGTHSLYQEKDTPCPVNNYGSTKLESENACLNNHGNAVIVRTNFYGWSKPGHVPTFGEWLYESLAQNKRIRLFTDYYFSPIEVTALAGAIQAVTGSDFRGVINIAGSERCSKYEFGIAMAEVFGFNTDTVTAVKMDENSFKVRRQRDLSLSVDKFRRLFDMELPGVKTGLARFKAAMPPERKAK